MTMSKLRSVVKSAGGTLEKDGLGGYEAIAPEGMRWKDAEVRFYPLPLSEAESKGEKNDMIAEAIRMLSEGVEKS